MDKKMTICRSIKDIKRTLKGQEIDRIYVDSIFDIPKDILKELKDRNIKLWVASKK